MRLDLKQESPVSFPNEDIFRAVSVSDSNRLEKNSLFALKVESAFFNKEGCSAPVYVEAIPKAKTLNFEISWEDFLYKKFKEEFDEKGLSSSESLLKIVNDFYRQVAEYEHKRIENSKNPLIDKKEIIAFLNGLIKKSKNGETILKLGWGTGLMSKTLNLKSKRTSPNSFPNTIKLARDNENMSLMGWCSIKLMPKEGS